MPNSNWDRAKFLIERQDGALLSVDVSGRNRWALECLRAAGSKGCTPIEAPEPRWSTYVDELCKLGIPISTIREAHGGDYAGQPARYVLNAKVKHVREMA